MHTACGSWRAFVGKQSLAVGVERVTRRLLTVRRALVPLHNVQEFRAVIPLNTIVNCETDTAIVVRTRTFTFKIPVCNECMFVRLF